MNDQTDDSPSTETPALIPTKPISPPLAPWQVFLLNFLTFTFYSSFWMYQAARDLTRLDSEKRTPVLWFLSPLLAITLIGSLPRLVGRYDVILGGSRWEPKATGLAIVTFVSSLTLNLSGRVEMGFWVILGAVVLYSLGFAFIQRATNALKADISEQHFTRKPFTFSVVHWIFLVLPAIAIAFYTYVEIDDQLSSEPSKPIATGTLLRIPDSDMTLAFADSGWKQVGTGTYSDGSATAEFEGPTDYQWLIVFDQGKDRNIYQWMDLRTETAEDPDALDLKCTESITTPTNSEGLSAEIICKGKDIIGDPILEIYVLRGINDEYWEAMAHLSAPRITFRLHEDKLRRLAKSLRSGSNQ